MAVVYEWEGIGSPEDHRDGDCGYDPLVEIFPEQKEQIDKDLSAGKVISFIKQSSVQAHRHFGEPSFVRAFIGVLPGRWPEPVRVKIRVEVEDLNEEERAAFWRDFHGEVA